MQVKIERKVGVLDLGSNTFNIKFVTFKNREVRSIFKYKKYINIIASTKFNKKYHDWIDGVEMPIAYTKKWGKGKVFHCSIGHYLKDFENLNVVKLITQGISWATK